MGMRGIFSIIKKADIVLLIVLILLGAGLSVPAAMQRSQGNSVRITVNGKLYGTYRLDEDQTIEVKEEGKTNIVKIEGKKVLMQSASCKNQICVHTGKISHAGQSIVCLPNRVSVTIEGKEAGEYDAVSGK